MNKLPKFKEVTVIKVMLINLRLIHFPTKSMYNICSNVLPDTDHKYLSKLECLKEDLTANPSLPIIFKFLDYYQTNIESFLRMVDILMQLTENELLNLTPLEFSQLVNQHSDSENTIINVNINDVNSLLGRVKQIVEADVNTRVPCPFPFDDADKYIGLALKYIRVYLANIKSMSQVNYEHMTRRRIARVEEGFRIPISYLFGLLKHYNVTFMTFIGIFVFMSKNKVNNLDGSLVEFNKQLKENRYLFYTNETMVKERFKQVIIDFYDSI